MAYHVIDAVGQVLFYGVLAAVSPLVLAATFVALRSEMPRRNGITFLCGFLVGTGVACIVGLVVGQAFVQNLDSRDELKAILTVLLGVGLLAAGLRARRLPPTSETRGSRATAVLAGLGNVGPAATFSMAGLLGFGGPKRLVLTLLAMAAVTGATLRNVIDLTLVVLYVAVATLLVSVPVALVVVAGERATSALARSQSWLIEHSATLRVQLALWVGALLLLDGVVRLRSCARTGAGPPPRCGVGKVLFLPRPFPKPVRPRRRVLLPV